MLEGALSRSRLLEAILDSIVPKDRWYLIYLFLHLSKKILCLFNDQNLSLLLKKFRWQKTDLRHRRYIIKDGGHDNEVFEKIIIVKYLIRYYHE